MSAASRRLTERWLAARITLRKARSQSGGVAARWCVVVAFTAATLTAWACNQPDTNPNDVISLAVDTAPAPSIIAGDTMRIGDSTALGRLTATAYNINGKVLNESVLWLTLDPAVVTTDAAGHVFAATDSVPSTPRIVAQIGGLQSLPFTIPIEPKPDSLASDTLADTSGQLIRGFCTATGPISAPLNADLFHTSPLGDSTPIGVDNYLVHWAITAPAKLAGKQNGTIADDSLVAFVADLSGNPTLIDTTKGGGISSREVIFGGDAFKLKQDSNITVTVTATARYQGKQLHHPVSVNITFVNPSKC